MLTKETLQNLLSAYKGDDLAGYLFDVQEQVKRTRYAVSSAKEEKEKERHKYESNLRAIDNKISILREGCLHFQTTYYPDPSGNNDSHTECDICGKELSSKDRKKWMKI